MGVLSLTVKGDVSAFRRRIFTTNSIIILPHIIFTFLIYKKKEYIYICMYIYMSGVVESKESTLFKIVFLIIES